MEAAAAIAAAVLVVVATATTAGGGGDGSTWRGGVGGRAPAEVQNAAPVVSKQQA